MTVLRKKRILKGISLQEEAKRVGTTKQRCYYIETHGITRATERVARNIADALDFNLFDVVSLEELIKFMPRDSEEFDKLEKLVREARENAGL